jgi:molybdate transport system ATP-binding protein
LLDEPLSALDGVTRAQLRPQLRSLLKQAGIPTVIVTHDRDEALMFADQMVVINDGTQRQVGSVEEVFARPKDLMVAQLAGVETIVRGKVLSNAAGIAVVQVGTTQLRAATGNEVPSDVHVCIRGEDVILERSTDLQASARNCLPAIVSQITSQGTLLRVELDAGFPLIALITRAACDELNLEPGSHISALVKAQSVHLLERG